VGEHLAGSVPAGGGPQRLRASDRRREIHDRFGASLTRGDELRDRRVDLGLTGVQREADTVVAVDDPVAVAVLHDLDRRQDREPVLGPAEPLPPGRPVATPERLQGQEIAAPLVTAADGRPRDLLDRDRAQPTWTGRAW
jgi:hypothetical protein